MTSVFPSLYKTIKYNMINIKWWNNILQNVHGSDIWKGINRIEEAKIRQTKINCICLWKSHHPINVSIYIAILTLMLIGWVPNIL